MAQILSQGNKTYYPLLLIEMLNSSDDELLVLVVNELWDFCPQDVANILIQELRKGFVLLTKRRTPIKYRIIQELLNYIVFLYLIG